MDKIWVVVSDRSRARIFHFAEGGHLDELHRLDHPESRAKGMDLVTDRPGSQRPKGGGWNQRSVMDRKTDPRRVEAEHFSRQLADFLERAHAQQAFERLVLVAPPEFLGLLRQDLNERVKKAIYATLDKDLSRLEPRELEEQVVTP